MFRIIVTDNHPIKEYRGKTLHLNNLSELNEDTSYSLEPDGDCGIFETEDFELITSIAEKDSGRFILSKKHPRNYYVGYCRIEEI